MAFLTPLPTLSSSSSPSSLTTSSFLNPHKCSTLLSPPGHAVRTPRRRAAAPRPLSMDLDPSFDGEKDSARAMSSSSARVVVRRAMSGVDLDAVYEVWNAVAAAEGLPALAPDEDDAAASTQHYLAELDDPSSSSTTSTTVVVGAGRLLRGGANNTRLDRCCVLPQYRLRGIGRMLVHEMMHDDTHTGSAGVTYVDACQGSEMGFFSILGFEPVGNDRYDEVRRVVIRTMLYTVPECVPPPPGGCVGLHHASLRVSDIERSLAFYGSVGFIVHDKFTTAAGARACFVHGLGTRLELVECPIAKNSNHGQSGGLAGVNVDSAHQGTSGIGFDRLVFDVTKACTDLDTYLQHLARRNGGHLQIHGPPAKQVVANCVMAVASILDPDGTPIEFIRREAQVPGELQTRVKW